LNIKEGSANKYVFLCVISLKLRFSRLFLSFRPKQEFVFWFDVA